MRVLSSLKDSPLGASHAASRALTCAACSREWHRASRSSAYLTTTGEPGLAVPALLPERMYRTPAASSIPCKATFISTGLMTPPTQVRTWGRLRVVVTVRADSGGCGRVASGGDGVTDHDLAWADQDLFHEQAQDALAVFDGCGGRRFAEGGQELFEVAGELEVDLAVGELGVEGLGLVAQAGLAGAQVGHPGTEFVEGDEVFLVGADQPGDRAGGFGE